MAVYIISLAIAIVMAIACYRIAERKGRNAILWGILGFVVPIIAIIIVLLLPDRTTTGTA